METVVQQFTTADLVELEDGEIVTRQEYERRLEEELTHLSWVDVGDGTEIALLPR